MRALAHPLRIALLDLLGEGERTATQCADATGESPASCSFHLRTLAKYGYIEPAERRGRERPWRLASRTQDFRPDHDDPASVHAAGDLARVWVDHFFDHVRTWIDTADDEQPEWVDASTICGAGLWLTVDELRDLSASIQALADPYVDRMDDPASRPVGARPARLFAVAAPDPAWEAREVAAAGATSARTDES